MHRALRPAPWAGILLSGAMEGGYMNENGDWAVVWDVDTPGEINVEALIVNGELLPMEGEAVDWTGDGVIDPDAIIDGFTGISSLTVGDRGLDGMFDVYFAADIDVAADEVLEGGFRLIVPEPTSLVLFALGVTLLRRR